MRQRTIGLQTNGTNSHPAGGGSAVTRESSSIAVGTVRAVGEPHAFGLAGFPSEDDDRVSWAERRRERGEARRRGARRRPEPRPERPRASEIRLVGCRSRPRRRRVDDERAGLGDLSLYAARSGVSACQFTVTGTVPSMVAPSRNARSCRVVGSSARPRHPARGPLPRAPRRPPRRCAREIGARDGLVLVDRPVREERIVLAPERGQVFLQRRARVLRRRRRHLRHFD